MLLSKRITTTIIIIIIIGGPVEYRVERLLRLLLAGIRYQPSPLSHHAHPCAGPSRRFDGGDIQHL